MTDNITIAEIIINLARFFRYDIIKSDLQPYYDELKEFEADEIHSATEFLKRKSRFFPKPIEISELIAPNASTLARLEVEYIFKVARNINLHYWPEEKKKMSELQLHLIQTLGGIGDISNLREGDIGPAKARMITIATEQVKRMNFQQQKKLNERQASHYKLQLIKNDDDPAESIEFEKQL